ncbi:phenylalanine--tRNA ligase subunit alpha [Candidatus Zinderia endosymbiont of Aphrophora alni]|uniref:phenylalanine--tRNA ligase subunit alpha n=1 Tax=Candidatus Zinderia endosymbiont of Aphrophora alni TaxID=3077951 RepID=UPI0030D15873
MINFEEFFKKIKKKFSKAKNINELIYEKSKYLGKNGKITIQIKKLSTFLKEKKKKEAIKINKIKKKIEKIFKKFKIKFNKINIKKKLNLNKNIDLTLPGRGKKIGNIHPINKVLEKIENFFFSIGFKKIEGPEIETDSINFTALNSPKNHPARSMHDTFYINAKDKENNQLLLRTHTSAMQIRYSIKNKPPIKIISTGKVYRVDNDKNHSPMFHQIEGFWIDKNINFSNLKYIYLNFIKFFFKNDNIKIRFRPSYFPFTEPSAEIDILFKEGHFKNKWLEVSGAGQIHPNVMKNININTNLFSGIAFGTGIERLTMLKYGINDIKLLYNGNLDFLKQFK